MKRFLLWFWQKREVQLRKVIFGDFTYKLINDSTTTLPIAANIIKLKHIIAKGVHDGIALLCNDMCYLLFCVNEYMCLLNIPFLAIKTKIDKCGYTCVTLKRKKAYCLRNIGNHYYLFRRNKQFFLWFVFLKIILPTRIAPYSVYWSGYYFPYVRIFILPIYFNRKEEKESKISCLWRISQKLWWKFPIHEYHV